LIEDLRATVSAARSRQGAGSRVTQGGAAHEMR
jgi:hypothetical protein